MPNDYGLFHQNPDSGQLARARELLELQDRVQQLINTLRNVHSDLRQTTGALIKAAPKSLFSSVSAAETFEYPTGFTAPTRIW